MTVKLIVTPSEQIEWLKTCGHAHKKTVKLIEQQHEIIRALMNPEIPAHEAGIAALEYLATFYPEPPYVEKKVMPREV